MDELVKHFEGTSALQLPTDFPRPLTRKFVEAVEEVDLPDQMCKRVLSVALEVDSTPFSVMLSVFLVLLHKMSVEDDIVVGSSTGTQEACALRVTIRGGELSFRQLIAAVVAEEALVDAHPVKFSDLMDALRPKKQQLDVEPEPLCQVRFFNMVDVGQTTLDAVGTCDWTVFIEQKADAKRILPLKIRVSYNSILFKAARIVELLNQMQFVLSQVVKSLDVLLDDVNLVTPFAQSIIPNPREVLSDRWEGSVQSYLSRHAALYPDRQLIVSSEGTYTYAQVDQLSNQVANFLITVAKIQKEDVVTIYAHRSAPLVVAIFGILKAGGTVCIIDPVYPPARQIVYLEVAQPKALIVLSAAGNLQPEVKEFLMKTPSIGTILRGLQMDVTKVPQLNDIPSTDPGVEVGPNNIGTLSFTSGSTGIPKGCRGRHISLTHFYPWMGREFSLSEHDRFSMLSGIAHDPIQRDIFTPVFFAAKILVPCHEDIVEPGRLAQWMARNEITITVLTPAMGQLLTADATTKMPSLRHAFFVGDVLTKRDAARLQVLAPNLVIVNMYGTTETQRSVSYFKIPNDPVFMAERKEILPAGKGMKDVQLLILNKRMQMVGIGEVGEIFVRSHHMAAGYLGLDEASSVKFLPNPFVENPGTDRFYRTGDVGRYLTDGVCECMGRADDQVKIRGFRIELREIDTFAVQHPDIREAVTMLRRDENEEKVLVLYFVHVRADVMVQSFDFLRAHLKEKLPSYAIPSIFVQLVRFPLTPNGKIDKGKLPFPVPIVGGGGSGSAAAAKTSVESNAVNNNNSATSNNENDRRSPVERVVHDAFAEFLPTKSFSDNDNFFDIGGHSVSSTRVIFRVRQKLQDTEIPLNLLYTSPSVRALAEAIERRSDFAKIVTEENSADLAAAQEQASKDVDLVAEANAPFGFTASADGKPFSFPESVQACFLTGATGFLGAFLVQSLLRSYDEIKVICLARAPNGGGDAEALARVRQNLEQHQVWEESFADRIVGVVGDISRPRWGLTEERFGELAASCDFVIHNGAVVHWVERYEALKAANVDATREAVRFCATRKIKPLYFVSSTAVFETEHYQNSFLVTEDDDLSHGASLRVGYGQTKWVSEQLVRRARTEIGVPSCIIRPGYIVGSTETGVTNSDDFLWRLLSGCLELGQNPQMKNRLNATPVDFVAELIVCITSDAAYLNKSFHTVNPNAFRYDDFFGQLRRFGYQVTPVEYLTWRNALETRAMQSQDSALFPLLHFVLDDLPTKSRAPRLDASNSAVVCGEFNLKCPPMEAVMGRYIAYLVSVGFFPKPPTSSSSAAEPLPELGKTNNVLLRRRK